MLTYDCINKLTVKRNIDRFPNNFMFQLAPEEYKSLRFLKKRPTFKILAPHAFTEQGVAIKHIRALDDAKLAVVIWFEMGKL